MRQLHWYIIVCFGLVNVRCVCCAGTPDKDHVLNMLRQTGSVYSTNGFTVGGSATKQPPSKRPGVPVMTRSWKMTYRDGIGAITYEAPNEPIKVSYVKPETSRYAIHDALGNAQVSVMTLRKVYCDTSSTKVYSEDLVHVVTPDNSVVNTFVEPRARLCDPGLTGAGRYIKEILWSIGRGFSDYIDEIVTIREEGNGTLHVVAKGRQSDIYFGNWHLVIDLEAAWMVRHATFYHIDYPEKIDLEVKNTGLIWNGPLAMPIQATVNYGGPINDKVETMVVSFAEISAGFDELVFSQVGTDTTPPYKNKRTRVLLERRNGRAIPDRLRR